jgi:site-specific recombinase XerD
MIAHSLNYCLKTGVHYTMHGLRHTFISDLVNKGYDIETVREMAGHKDITTTQRYLAPREQTIREAVGEMGEEMNGYL